MPFGILREPALQDPLLLANDFVNAPETGKLLVLCEKVFALGENEKSKIQTAF